MGDLSATKAPRPNADFSSDRPAIDIRLPAIARHVAYRIPKAYNPRSLSDAEAQTAAWGEILEALCGHFREIATVLCRAEPSVECYRDAGGKFRIRDDRGEIGTSRSILIDYGACATFGRAAVRADIYNETIAITYIFSDLAAAGPDGVLGAKFRELTATDEAGAEVRNRALDYLQNGFWQAEFKDARLAGEPFSPSTQLLDFRGVYLDCDRREHHRPLDREPQKAPLIEFAEHRRGLVDHAIGRGPRPREDLRGEPVFCFMLDGDALYLAELGRRDEDGGAAPLRHMLVFADAPSSQVGRLVRRLHVMGELRHGALLDYDNGSETDLRRVSRELRRFGPGIDRILADAGPKPDDAKAPASDSDLSSVLKEVAALRANRDEEGITYRIEQSRYYAEEFRHGLRHLRVVRIPGYQSYQDFVSRYIFQAFARIDAIGNRYDAMLRRLNLATGYRTTEEIGRYQREIDKAGKRQTILLKTAESVAYAIMAYYGGSALHTAVEATLAPEASVRVGSIELSGHAIGAAVDWLWVAVVVTFIARAWRQARRADSDLAALDPGARDQAGLPRRGASGHD